MISYLNRDPWSWLLQEGSLGPGRIRNECPVHVGVPLSLRVPLGLPLDLPLDFRLNCPLDCPSDSITALYSG